MVFHHWMLFPFQKEKRKKIEEISEKWNRKETAFHITSNYYCIKNDKGFFFTFSQFGSTAVCVCDGIDANRQWKTRIDSGNECL